MSSEATPEGPLRPTFAFLAGGGCPCTEILPPPLRSNLCDAVHYLCLSLQGGLRQEVHLQSWVPEAHDKRGLKANLSFGALPPALPCMATSPILRRAKQPPRKRPAALSKRDCITLLRLLSTPNPAESRSARKSHLREREVLQLSGESPKMTTPETLDVCFTKSSLLSTDHTTLLPFSYSYRPYPSLHCNQATDAVRGSPSTPSAPHCLQLRAACQIVVITSKESALTGVRQDMHTACTVMHAIHLNLVLRLLCEDSALCLSDHSFRSMTSGEDVTTAPPTPPALAPGRFQLSAN